MLNLGKGGRSCFSALFIADGMVGTVCIVITATRDTQVLLLILSVKFLASNDFQCCFSLCISRNILFCGSNIPAHCHASQPLIHFSEKSNLKNMIRVSLFGKLHKQYLLLARHMGLTMRHKITQNIGMFPNTVTTHFYVLNFQNIFWLVTVKIFEGLQSLT